MSTLNGSVADSQILMTKEDSYWVQRVDQLMQDKREVIKLIKKKNWEIRAAEQKNQQLELDLKSKETLIENMNLAKLLKTQKSSL